MATQKEPQRVGCWVPLKAKWWVDLMAMLREIESVSLKVSEMAHRLVIMWEIQTVTEKEMRMAWMMAAQKEPQRVGC